MRLEEAWEAGPPYLELQIAGFKPIPLTGWWPSVLTKCLWQMNSMSIGLLTASSI